MPILGTTGDVSESKYFEWKITDFLSLSAEENSMYTSPSFVFENTCLNMFIFPRGCLKAVSGFISVGLANKTSDPLHANIMFHIKNADGTLIGGEGGTASIKTDVGIPNFHKRFELEKNKAELLPSGILTIVCILKRVEDGNQATVKANIVKESVYETSDYRRLAELDVLSENLKDLSTNEDSCDVVLKVQDQEFKAHKAILMARSSVFAAMFQHDTLEKQTGTIKISDCDSESFQEFLDYLYSGKLEDVSFRSAFHLYSTSNKYDVQKLKEFCIKYLMEGVSVDNVCDIVKLADKYDEEKLLTRAQEFFNENWNRIFPTAEWRSFMASNLRLADKLLVEFSKTKDSQ